MRAILLACVCCIPVGLLCGPAEVSGQKKDKKKTDDTPVPKKEDVPKLINQLVKGTSAKDRAFAATQLGRAGQIQINWVKGAIEPLQKSLQKDADPGVRRAAAEALGMIAPDPETTVPILIEAVKDEKLEVNLAAIEALGRYGPEAKAALPILREFLKTRVKDKKKDANIFLTVTAALREISGKKKG